MENRMIEIDFEGNPESVMGVETGPLVIHPDFNRLQDADKSLGGRLFLNTGGLNQEYKRSGTAVHDRNFGVAEVYCMRYQCPGPRGRTKGAQPSKRVRRRVRASYSCWCRRHWWRTQALPPHGSRSMRRKMMPVLTAAGRSVMNTFSPVWIPTPVARITFLRVRCFIIIKDSSSPENQRHTSTASLLIKGKNRRFDNICCYLTTF